MNETLQCLASQLPAYPAESWLGWTLFVAIPVAVTIAWVVGVERARTLYPSSNRDDRIMRGLAWTAPVSLPMLLVAAALTWGIRKVR